MTQHIKELKETIEMLESEEKWLTSQVFLKQIEIDQKDQEIDALNHRRQKVAQMLYEDRLELSELNEENID